MLTGGSYAVMHAGIADSKGFETAWTELVEWAQRNGHAPDEARPDYEIYLNNPEQHPQKHQIVDLCFGVNS